MYSFFYILKDKSNNHIPHDEESHAFLQSQIDDEKLDLHEETLHDREIRIKSVSKGLHEVHKLYSEVAEIGAIQTQKIDHISDNIEKTGLKIMLIIFLLFNLEIKKFFF
jgi:hypothetical protein